MISHFARYGIILIALLFSSVFFADYWYQQNQHRAQLAPLEDSIETIRSLCQQYPCSDGSQFGKAMLINQNLLHFPPSILNALNSQKVVEVNDSETGKLYAYAALNTQLSNNEQNTTLLIRYGPYSPEAGSSGSGYTTLFYSLLALAIFAGLYPLFREMAKLKKAAEAFGQTGEFSALPTEKSAFFQPVNNAFATMTRKIAQLLALQKELSDTLSHELRTPLSRIRFAKEVVDSENLEEFKQDIDLDLDEMESLVEEYLSFSRLEHEEPQLEIKSQQPLPIVQKHVELFDKFTTKNISLQHNCTGHTQIEIDQKKFSRAVKNLIDNACKYAHSEVLVTITDQPESGRVQIAIDDNGTGIHEQEIDELFLPYTRAKGVSASGFGLGLAITRKIVLWHNGELSVKQSEKIGGACFTLSLPYQQPIA